MNIQYAEIPLDSLEIISSSKKEKDNKLRKIIKLFKLKPTNHKKIKSIIVKIKLDKNPYIEEIVTKKKIGLVKEDGYNIYLKGDTIYNLCSTQDAFIKTIQKINYKEEVLKLFNQN
ncbi:MAG: hypothetical protein IKF91_01705 [Bacilli bacterium]|nr:hypothetical protein [Bacilli bacterium]